MEKQLNIGLFGLGCVGYGLYEVLNQSGLLNARIKKIVVQDPTKKREVDNSLISFNKADILKDESINVVIELINDKDAAYRIVTEALKSGKHVVTANKKLIAEHLDELIFLAKANHVSLLYEAAVAGSIPIIRNLEEYYNNDTLSSIQGILNGTTNYILTRTQEGTDFNSALSQAQLLGFAELDPTLDLEGFDPKFKLLILIKHAFGLSLHPNQIFNFGITNLLEKDVRYASERGYRIKLIAKALKIGDQVFAIVAPSFVAQKEFTYGVQEENNAVVVEALFSNSQLFIGKGAGSHPTASAVLSDVSALKYNYQYEYIQSRNPQLNFSNNFLVRAYVANSDPSYLNAINFLRIDERYQSENHGYLVGWIALKDLPSVQNSGTSLILLPDTPIVEPSPEELTNEFFNSIIFSHE